MNKEETIADVLFAESDNLKIRPSIAERFNFTNIKEIRIGDFVYQNPNITITETTNEEYRYRIRRSV